MYFIKKKENQVYVNIYKVWWKYTVYAHIFQKIIVKDTLAWIPLTHSSSIQTRLLHLFWILLKVLKVISLMCLQHVIKKLVNAATKWHWWKGRLIKFYGVSSTHFVTGSDTLWLLTVPPSLMTKKGKHESVQDVNRIPTEDIYERGLIKQLDPSYCNEFLKIQIFTIFSNISCTSLQPLTQFLIQRMSFYHFVCGMHVLFFHLTISQLGYLASVSWFGKIFPNGENITTFKDCRETKFYSKPGAIYTGNILITLRSVS